MSSELNPALELASLFKDAAEYLRFLQTLGVTHVGGSVRMEEGSGFRVQGSEVEGEREAEVQSEEILNSQLSTLNSQLSTLNSQLSTFNSKDPESRTPNPELQDQLPVAKMVTVMPNKPPAKPLSPQGSLFDFMATPDLVTPPQKTFSDTCLQDIRDEIGDCQRCKLASGRHHIVFGDGHPHPDLVFVGEAPGADEDATGVPFVGRAGQLLNKIIEAIGMKRSEVYICNVIKCRPPENRTPEKDEIEACSGFLHRQLALLKPKIIVSLGAPAAFTLLGDNKLGRITDIRGTFYTYREIPLMVTFHPAYLLRWPAKKREVWEDMKKVRAYLRGELKLE